MNQQSKSDLEMGTLNVEQLAGPISEDAPCGENLEEKAEFRRIEKEVEMAAEPDWDSIKGQSLALLERTKDLRLCVFLAAAALRQPKAGFSNFKNTLSLIRMLLEERWETVHPQADATDKNPFWRRAQAIEELSTPVGKRGDNYGIVEKLRILPLTRLDQKPLFCRRDIMIIRGELAVPEDEKEKLKKENKDEGTLASAFSQTLSEAREFLDTVAGDAREAAANVEVILTQFRKKAKGSLLDLGLLKSEILAIAKEVEDRLGYKVEVSEETEPVQSEAPSRDPVNAELVETTVKQQATSIGKISSREEVLVAINRILDYYQQHEPSSPVPLLLQRARRFVNMNFLDIVREIAGDAAGNMKIIFGPESAEK